MRAAPTIPEGNQYGGYGVGAPAYYAADAI